MLSFPITGPAAQRVNPPYVTGRHYSTIEGAISSTTAVPAVDTIYLYPFRVFNTITLTAAMIRTSTGGTGSSVKAGIWANSPVSARPLGAPLIVDNTGAATTGSNTNVTLAMTGTLSPGVYWAGTKHTGTLPQTFSIAAQSQYFLSMVGIASGGSASTSGLSYADTYSNNMPTLAEGASFSSVATAGIPILYLTT